MIKSDVNPVDALRRAPRRSCKNGNLNRGGMSNNNKICFRCGGVYPYKVKFPAESNVCHKCKNMFKKMCKKKAIMQNVAKQN